MRLSPKLRAALAVLLPCLLLFPLLLPGQLIHRDMVVLDHPALSLGAFGFGDLPARNAPQDGALALIGTILPASWAARVALFGAAIWGCWHERKYPAAMLLLLVNPFVVERLLQGQWSLVIAALLLPIVANPAAGAQRFVALWLCSLTPTGAVVGVITALVVGGQRARLAGFGLAYALPWIVPSLIHSAPASTGAQVFAARAETYVGTLGALAGLGGIWNSHSVPASRHAGFALAGIALCALLLTAFRSVPNRLLALAGAGFVLSTLGWLAPALLELLLQVPGGGLLRDGQKWIILAIPAYVALARHVRMVWLLVSLTLLQVPDATAALWELRPTNALVARYGAGEDVLFTDLPGTLDPRTKASASVESGELIVGGSRIDAPSPRYTAALSAWQHHDLAELQRLEVGVVVDGEHVTQIPNVVPRRGWEWRTGFGLSIAWLLLPILPLLPALWPSRKNHSRRSEDSAGRIKTAPLTE